MLLGGKKAQVYTYMYVQKKVHDNVKIIILSTLIFCELQNSNFYSFLFRFEEEESAGRPPCSFIPLGQGPRNCVGMKLAKIVLKTALATILCHHRLTTATTTKPLVHKNFIGLTSCFQHDVFLNLQDIARNWGLFKTVCYTHKFVSQA